MLTEFHQKRNKELEKEISEQPDVSLEEAMQQYDRIKAGSSRVKQSRLKTRGDLFTFLL